MCTEKWNIHDHHIRCVRIESEGKRPFLTTDWEAGKDIDFAYQSFMVTAGWSINGATTSPFLFNSAPAQSVDFGKFLLPAPESTYNSAFFTTAITCVSLAAAVLTFSF